MYFKTNVTHKKLAPMIIRPHPRKGCKKGKPNASHMK